MHVGPAQCGEGTATWAVSPQEESGAGRGIWEGAWDQWVPKQGKLG